MITESFSFDKPIIEPWMFYGRKEKTLDICLITFSHKIFKEAEEMEGTSVLTELESAGGKHPVLLLPVKEKRVGIILSPVGAPSCGAFMEDCHALTGVESFILFGSAGALDREKTEGKYVVVTSAYRDEGLSYHYLPPKDYVDIRGWEKLSAIFSSLSVPFVEGRTWTTDAIYRETKSEMEKRRSEGCLVVEMEAAGAAAVAEHHGWSLLAFLEGGDNLDGEEWSVGNLSKANHSSRKLFAAIEAARMLEC